MAQLRQMGHQRCRGQRPHARHGTVGRRLLVQGSAAPQGYPVLLVEFRNLIIQPSDMVLGGRGDGPRDALVYAAVAFLSP